MREVGERGSLTSRRFLFWTTPPKELRAGQQDRSRAKTKPSLPQRKERMKRWSTPEGRGEEGGRGAGESELRLGGSKEEVSSKGGGSLPGRPLFAQLQRQRLRRRHPTYRPLFRQPTSTHVKAHPERLAAEQPHLNMKSFNAARAHAGAQGDGEPVHPPRLLASSLLPPARGERKSRPLPASAASKQLPTNEGSSCSDAIASRGRTSGERAWPGRS